MTAFSEDERLIAKALCKQKSTMEFLHKLFTPEIDPAEKELSQNVVALDDAEYGRMMKIVYISKASFEKKMQLLKVLGGANEKRTGGPIAPH